MLFKTNVSRSLGRRIYLIIKPDVHFILSTAILPLSEFSWLAIGVMKPAFLTIAAHSYKIKYMKIYKILNMAVASKK